MIEAIVAGAMIKNGRILLCHRSPDRRWYPDVWDLPGGHVELGESPTDALKRELLEELGISVHSLSPHPLDRTLADPVLVVNHELGLVPNWELARLRHGGRLGWWSPAGA